MSFFNLRRRKLLKLARRGADRLLSTATKEYMTDYVVSVSPEKHVTEAASVMIGEDVSGLIIEEEGKPIGILTERDFITKVPLSSKVFGLKVRDIMSCAFSTGKTEWCAVEAVTPETTLAQALNVLKQKRIRKLAVTNPEGLLAGIITQTDLSKALYEKLKVVVLQNGPFQVKDVMSKGIIATSKRASFASAKKLMTEKNISALPVQDGKEYIGIFTEYDVVTQFYDAGGKLDIKGIPELMKTPLKAIPSELNIFDANMIMLFEKVRRLVVIEEGKPVGIVTQTDLVHACFDYVERFRKRLEGETTIREEDLLTLRQKESIISEYAGEHIRAFTVRKG